MLTMRVLEGSGTGWFSTVAVTKMRSVGLRSMRSAASPPQTARVSFGEADPLNTSTSPSDRTPNSVPSGGAAAVVPGGG